MKKENENKKEFTSSDLYASAFLRLSGFDLIGIDKSDSRRFIFIFNDKAGRIKLLDDYFMRRSVVEPCQFIAAVKELKNLMYRDALRP
jgi:trans-2-enoyl-CoA reductase